MIPEQTAAQSHVPLPIIIRRATAFDETDIRQVNRAAFGTDAEANLVDALRAGGYAEVELAAVNDEKVIGHILFSRVGIRTSSAAIGSLSLAPMAVLPEYQRRGIGGELVRQGIKACRDMGHASVLVLGHPDFYPRFGFSAERARRLTSPFGGGNAWMVIELIPGALAGMEGQVEYPPPFLGLSP